MAQCVSQQHFISAVKNEVLKVVRTHLGSFLVPHVKIYDNQVQKNQKNSPYSGSHFFTNMVNFLILITWLSPLDQVQHDRCELLGIDA